MVLLRRVIGDALRARRQGQHRTLREVSTAANVSLGYLSEIERGQKEASSELLAAICDALGARLSELLREVSDTLSVSEEMADMLTGVDGAGVTAASDQRVTTPAGDRRAVGAGAVRSGTGPTDAIGAGSVPAEAIRAGSVQTGSVRAGSVRGGAVPAEAVRARAIRAEAIRAEAIRAAQAVRAEAVGTDPETTSIRVPLQADPARRRPGDGEVSVSVLHAPPLRATLRAARNVRPADRERDVVYAA